MPKLVKKLNQIRNKIIIIIKKYILPIFITIMVFIIFTKWLGFDLYYSKMMNFFKINDENQLEEILIVLLCLWLAYDYATKKIVIENSKDEYREYLLKELDDNLEQSNINNLKESVAIDTDKEIKNPLNNVITEQNKTNKKDIIALMLKNNDEITEYFKISKSQAKSSFWFSVISCIVGMGALAVGIYGIVILKDVSVSVISLISGSISELISGTVFWVHNKSALQLNHYYDALHENEKFLSAVNIADKLSAEKKEDILVEIIHKQINNETPKIELENTKEKNN